MGISRHKQIHRLIRRVAVTISSFMHPSLRVRALTSSYFACRRCESASMDHLFHVPSALAAIRLVGRIRA